MAISYIGGATGTNSATLPTHAADDLIVGFAFRDGLAALPTVPAGWTTIVSSTGTLCGAAIAYKVAASSGETSGTWTNADSLLIQVYRGIDTSAPIGASNINPGNNTANTVAYAALTFSNTSGTSWGLAAAGHRSNAGGLNLSIAPTGYTNRTYANDATDKAAGHDSAAGATGFTAGTVTVGGGSTQGWITTVVEILEGASGINGDGAGTSETTGAAAGSVSIAGAGSGASDTTGAAAGSIAIAAAGSGSANTTGAAAGSVAVSGAGSGASDTTGAATGTVASAGIAGAGAGTAETTGSATGSIAIAAAGSGAANTTGSAAGTAAIAGSGSGAANTTGASAGSVSIAGAGSGTANTTGAVAGSVQINGAGAGQANTTGAATGSDTSPVVRIIRMRTDGRLEAYLAP